MLIEAQHPQIHFPSFGPDVPEGAGAWSSWEMWVALTSPDESQPDNQLEGITQSQQWTRRETPEMMALVDSGSKGAISGKF